MKKTFSPEKSFGRELPVEAAGSYGCSVISIAGDAATVDEPTSKGSMRRRAQRGFSIITAIFLLVVLAFLGVAMVTFSTSQHQSSALDVIGTRAYHAARAGIEWGAYQVLPASAGAFATACRAGTTSQGVTPLPGTLSGFNVNVECSATAHTEDAATITVYQLTSTASQGTVATPGYVERQMTVTIAK